MSVSDTFPFVLPPWQHQKDAFDRALLMRDYALFMDLGTGKTATTINVLRYRYAVAKRVMRTLVIGPVVIGENWRREFGVHSKSQAQVVVARGTGAKKLAAIRGGKQIIVINYESFDSEALVDALWEWRPEIIIADESQRCKNYKAKRTKAICSLGSLAQHRYILSGTPILNSPMDIFAQYLFLDQGATFGRNFYSFRATYFEDKNAGMPSQKYFPNWQPKAGSFDALHALIYAKASRVTKAEALDLPQLVRKEVAVDMGKDQARMYGAMRDQLVAYLGDRACVAKLALTKALRLQQMVSGHFVDDAGRVTRYEDCPRIDALSDLVQQIVIDGGHKLIVWASFTDNYAMIGEALTKLGVKWCQLVGGMTDTTRQKAIDDFQGGDAQVIVANQRAGGVGISLIAASYMLYYSKSFSLEDDLQSESRNHRGGSERHDKITRIDLVCPGTIDEKITGALAKKMKMADDILSLKDLLCS